MSKAKYHYEIGGDGKKHRVYEKSRKRTTAPKRVLKGRGGYYDSSFVKKANKYVPKGFWNKMGMTAGGMVGGPEGAVLGGAAGSGIAKLLGFGAYRVKSNSLLDEGQSPAAMHSTNSSLRVRHREYIGDIVSSSTANAFNSNVYPINPGQSSVFPWLAPIASQYEQYKILGMVFEFKTLSADAVASSQANMTIGGIIMSTNYNAVAPVFANKQAMDNAEYTTSAKPSQSLYHAIECAPGSYATSQLFVRNGAPPANSDLRMYDLGNFQIASFGIAATSVVLGELWCSYEIELSKPVSNFASGDLVLTDHYKLGTVTNTSPLGTASILATNSSIGGTIDALGRVYTFPANITSGQFLVVYQVVGTAAALVAPGLTVTGCNVATTWLGSAGPTLTNVIDNAGSTSARYIRSFIVDFNVPGASAATIAFGTGGTLPSAAVGGDLYITQIDDDISS